MRKQLFSVLAALAAGVAFGFTPTAHTNAVTRDGVTYVQRGALGAADYVVTNIDANAVGKVKSVNGLTGDVVLVATNVGALADSRTALTNSANFNSAIEYKANAEVKQVTYEYRFDGLVDGDYTFDFHLGLGEAVNTSFSGNTLRYARVWKNGVEWTVNVSSWGDSWFTAYDSNGSGYVTIQKTSGEWRVRISNPYKSFDGTEPDFSLENTYRTVGESISNFATNRKVNNQPLSADVTITAAGLGAVETNPSASETKLYGSQYTLTDGTTGNRYRELKLENDRIMLYEKDYSTNRYVVVRNWNYSGDGFGFDVEDENGFASFILPDKTSNQSKTYHFATAEDVAADYATKTGATATAEAAVTAGLDSYQPLYVWDKADSTAVRRLASDGTLYYKKWSVSTEIAWTNRETGVVLYPQTSNNWSGTDPDLGSVNLIYNNGTYYIQQFPDCRYTETLEAETTIRLSLLGTFEAFVYNQYSGSLTWRSYGTLIQSGVFGNDSNAKASLDWWYRQGVKWEIDDNELLWDGEKWTYTNGADRLSVAFKTQPSDSSDEVVYTYTAFTNGVTTSVDSESVDYRSVNNYDTYVMFGSTYAYRMRLRNVSPKDFTVADWAREATPPESMDYNAVTNISAYVSTNVLGLAKDSEVVHKTQKINGQPLTGDITIEAPMDYQAITNTVNAVKAQFWDEPLQVNWTLKMVNGEMKLYATTNVNMSTLRSVVQ